MISGASAPRRDSLSFITPGTLRRYHFLPRALMSHFARGDAFEDFRILPPAGHRLLTRMRDDSA